MIIYRFDKGRIYVGVRLDGSVPPLPPHPSRAIDMNPNDLFWGYEAPPETKVVSHSVIG